MTEGELRQFVGETVEAVLLDKKMVLHGTFRRVENGYVVFSSISDIFVLPHGKRLSLQRMLAGSFVELESLLRKVSFPYDIFDKCQKTKSE